MRAPFHVKPSMGLVLLGCLTLQGPSLAQSALPFDPIPSAFQRWLNSQRDWPKGQSVQFSGLGECQDQTAAHSPYRMPVFTCLEGTVRRSGGGQASEICRVLRVSYFPSVKRTRLWTTQCRSAS